MLKMGKNIQIGDKVKVVENRSSGFDEGTVGIVVRLDARYDAAEVYNPTVDMYGAKTYLHTLNELELLERSRGEQLDSVESMLDELENIIAVISGKSDEDKKFLQDAEDIIERMFKEVRK